MSSDRFRLRVESDITALAAAQWNACANPEPVSVPTSPGTAPADRMTCTPSPSGDASEIGYNPFISHEFLSALEESGSASARTGWRPQHLVLEGEGGAPLAVCPAYLKSHSQGEYVFDQGWADAYERAGGNYYPKLQVSVPFTPATGPRLLVRPGPQAGVARRALAQGLATLCEMRGASSVHATFLNDADADALEGEGWLPRLDQQFHWSNQGYGGYEDFLGQLASRKRKAIRRERRDALAGDIEIRWLTGKDITEADWDAFYAFYMETGSRKWGRPYLNRRFYSLIGERMADRVLLVMARRAGRWIAGAINFIGADTLYGRHWGCVEDHPFLHFEVCYHQAIDFAIARGLKTVEAGAQGEHKLARGYLPVTTRSAHYIADPQFRAAVAAYLEHERAYAQEAQAELAEHAPFRHGAGHPDEEP